MKKVFLVIMLVGISVNSFSQTLGVKAGFSLATFSSGETKMTPGFLVGSTVDFGLKSNMAFQTGLLFSVKGAKVDGGTNNERLIINYLELPLLLKKSFELKEDGKIFITGGPYLAYGLSAKAKASSNGRSYSENIEFGDDGLNRIDIGLSLGAGVELSKLQFGLSYGLGLTKIADNDDAPKNSVLSFTLGYKF